MTSFLYANAIRIFDYPQFAATLRDTVRENAAKVAEAAGVAIEHISKSCLRKEDIVAKAIARRGEHPGLAHVISAMEACGAYEPWHDKKSHKTFVRPDSGKCLHYYFYFIDAELGLIYVRVPTWAPSLGGGTITTCPVSGSFFSRCGGIRDGLGGGRGAAWYERHRRHQLGDDQRHKPRGLG